MLLVGLFTLGLAIVFPFWARFLAVAYIVRVCALLCNAYILPLPDSTRDAIAFENRAWEFAQGGLSSVLQHFTGPDSFFISWLISIIYTLTDRSVVLAQSVSLLFGMCAVVIGSLLARELWGDRSAIKAGWFLALFPTLVLYSALIMREAYVWFFFLLAIYGVVRWVKYGSFRYFLISVGGIVGASFFHGAMAVGGLFLVFYVGFRACRKMVLGFSKGYFPASSFLYCFLIGFSLIVFLNVDLKVPKIGSISSLLDPARIVELVSIRESVDAQEMGAGFPDSLKIVAPIDIIFKAPLRMVYFVFSPFPWDVSKLAHLIGLFDGLLYLAIFVFIWRNRKAIKSNPGAIAILFFICAYVFVFSFGTGNFGTGLRHRAKFSIGLIVLAAPALPMFRFRFWYKPSIRSK